MESTVEAIRTRVLFDIDRIENVVRGKPMEADIVAIKRDFIMHVFGSTSPEELKHKITSYGIDNRLKMMLNDLKNQMVETGGSSGSKMLQTPLPAPTTVPNFLEMSLMSQSADKVAPTIIVSNFTLAEINNTIHSLTFNALVNRTSAKCSNCGGEMEILPAEQSAKCKSCPLVIDTFGSISTINHSHNGRTVTNSSKSHEYKTIYIKCMREIKGEMSCDIGTTNTAKLVKLIESNKKPYITCKEMRQYLKTLNATKYNNKIPYLLRTYGNAPAINFTVDEQHTMQIYFVTICIIIDEIKATIMQDRKNNINRYVIFYNSARACIKDQEKIELIETLLSFPNQATMILYDNMMKQVCERLKEYDLNLTYRPTPMYLIP